MSSNLILNSLLTIKTIKTMCLFKDKNKHPFNRPLIAEEDIVCYKQLDTSRFTDGYITPCTYSEVPAACLKKKVPFKAEILNKFEFFLETCTRI